MKRAHTLPFGVRLGFEIAKLAITGLAAIAALHIAKTAYDAKRQLDDSSFSDPSRNISKNSPSY